jgi:hypothetical protein
VSQRSGNYDFAAATQKEQENCSDRASIQAVNGGMPFVWKASQKSLEVERDIDALPTDDSHTRPILFFEVEQKIIDVRITLNWCRPS